MVFQFSHLMMKKKIEKYLPSEIINDPNDELDIIYMGICFNDITRCCVHMNALALQTIQTLGNIEITIQNDILRFRNFEIWNNPNRFCFLLIELGIILVHNLHLSLYGACECIWRFRNTNRRKLTGLPRIIQLCRVRHYCSGFSCNLRTVLSDEMDAFKRFLQD